MATSWDNLPAVDPEQDDDDVSARQAPWANLPSADVELKKEEEEERSTIDQIGRTLGVGARALVEGAVPAVMGIPTLTADAIDALNNMARMGYNVFVPEEKELELLPNFASTRRAMEAGEKLASMTPFPEPETAGERILTEGIKFGEAVATGSGGAKLLQKLTAPTAAELPSRLNAIAADAARRPVLSTVGGTGSGLALQTGIEAGQPELGFAAALLAPGATGAAASAARKIRTPLPSQLNEYQKSLVQAAKKTGQTITAAEKAGSPRFKTFEDQLSKLPGGAASPARTQQEEFNRAISRSFGENEPAITQDVLQRSAEAIGSEINKIITPKQIPFDAGFAQKVKEVSESYAGYLPSDVKGPFRNIRNDLYKLIDPAKPVPGKEVQRIRSKLLERARNTNDRDYKDALLDLREVLDDHVERFIPDEAERFALREARNRYRNLSRVEDSLRGQTPSDIRGDVSGSKILRATAKEDQSAALRGQSYQDLRTPAKIATSLATSLGDSGTALRNYYTRLAALLGGGGTAGGLLGSSPTDIAIGAGSAIAAPYLANRLYWSSPMQKYLSNQRFAGRESLFPPRLAPLIATQQGGGLLSQ